MSYIIHVYIVRYILLTEEDRNEGRGLEEPVQHPLVHTLDLVLQFSTSKLQCMIYGFMTQFLNNFILLFSHAIRINIRKKVI